MQCPEQLPRIERQELPKALPQPPHGPAIGTRLSEEQDQVTVGIVSCLEREAALESLGVSDAGLCVDAAPPRCRLRPSDVGVPGTEVTIHRERYLASPADARVEPRAEALEKCELRAIADRVACWKGADAEVKANDSEPGTQLLDRDAAELASLQSQHLLVRGASRGGHFAETQTSGHSGQAVLLPGAPHRFPGTSAAAVDRSLSGSHADHPGARPFTDAYAWPGRVWSGHRTNGRASTRKGPEMTPATLNWSGHGTTRQRRAPHGVPEGAPAVPWSVGGTKRAVDSAARRAPKRGKAPECHP